MSNRELERCRREKDILLEQLKATEAQWLIDNNPGSRVLLKKQIEHIEAKLAEAQACIDRYEKGIGDIPPPPPPASKRVLFTSAVPQTYADFDMPEEAIFREYRYITQSDKSLIFPRLLRGLRDNLYDIWHHHGYFGADGLVICDMQKRPTVLSLTEIADTLRDDAPRLAGVVWVIAGDPAPLPIAQIASLVALPMVIVPAGMPAPTRQTFLGALYDQTRHTSLEGAYHHAQKYAQTDMPILLAHHSHIGGKA